MKIIKNIVKRLFCKHEYHYLGEVIWTEPKEEIHDMTIRCKKCGKEITIIYKKGIDK